MSDIKKIKDDLLIKVKENLDLNQVNQLKTDVFGKKGLKSSQFKKLGEVSENERKMIIDHNQTYSISLAKNILKSETAALSAITIVNHYLNLS